MKNYKYIFFDLDGTLTDSGEGIFDSLKYVFDHYGVDDTKLSYKDFVGPPLKVTMENIISKDKSIVDDAMLMYREHYLQNGVLKKNRVYDGIEETLEFLCKKGYELGIVTSKPEPSAKSVLDHFDLRKYFSQVFTPTKHGEKAEKYEILMEALETCNCSNLEAVMVGDRMYDLEAAEKASVDAIGVLYGYGSLEELKRYPNIFFANKPIEIIKFFQSNN